MNSTHQLTLCTLTLHRELHYLRKGKVKFRDHEHLRTFMQTQEVKHIHYAILSQEAIPLIVSAFKCESRD